MFLNETSFLERDLICGFDPHAHYMWVCWVVQIASVGGGRNQSDMLDKGQLTGLLFLSQV